MINKLIEERDWSVREISHMLLEFDLKDGPRAVINVNLYPENELSTCYIQNDQEDGSDGVKAMKFPLEKYMNPDVDLYDDNKTNWGYCRVINGHPEAIGWRKFYGLNEMKETDLSKTSRVF